MRDGTFPAIGRQTSEHGCLLLDGSADTCFPRRPSLSQLSLGLLAIGRFVVYLFIAVNMSVHVWQERLVTCSNFENFIPFFLESNNELPMQERRTFFQSVL